MTDPKRERSKHNSKVDSLKSINQYCFQQKNKQSKPLPLQ